MILPPRLRWLWLTLAVILADRATKAWFETQTQEGWRRELIHNFIYLVHSRNSGIALLLGGATGNVTDRIIHGAVTDFFEVWFGSYHYPAFNVADSAIAIGAALTLLDVLFGQRLATRGISKEQKAKR